MFKKQLLDLLRKKNLLGFFSENGNYYFLIKIYILLCEVMSLVIILLVFNMHVYFLKVCHVYFIN